jgi:hypothetical protein
VSPVGGRAGAKQSEELRRCLGEALDHDGSERAHDNADAVPGRVGGDIPDRGVGSLDGETAHGDRHHAVVVQADLGLDVVDRAVEALALADADGDESPSRVDDPDIANLGKELGA